MSLETAVHDKGYTPKARDAAALVGLLATEDDALAKAVTRALLLVPAAAEAAAVAALATATRPLRGRVVRLLDRLAEGGDDAAKARLLPVLIGLVGDADIKARLAAIGALAQIPGVEAESALLARWQENPRPEEKRALVKALGQAGSARALDALADVDAVDDAELARRLEQAKLILARTLARGDEGRVAGDVPLPGMTEVHLRCRAGLEALLAQEGTEPSVPGTEPFPHNPKGTEAPVPVPKRSVGGATSANPAGLSFDALPPPVMALSPRVLGPGLVSVRTREPLSALLRLRLLDWLAFPLAVTAATPEDAAVAALSSPQARSLLTALTVGPVRYRISWPDASRARLWELARRLSEACPAYVNDPTRSVWEVELARDGQRWRVFLVPKRLDDPRFSYRQGMVPASSHPTIAAALARVAGAHADDVVWDPFAGAGTELVERALLGPCKTLWGSDVSAEAVAHATANLNAAGVKNATVAEESCLGRTGLAPTLILTNPPMGRRVLRGELKEMIARFTAHAARELAPGGRLVWLSPLPDDTAAQLGAAGLTLTYRQPVDMGGFYAELQRAVKGTP